MLRFQRHCDLSFVLVFHFRVTLDHGAQVCLYRRGGTLPRQSAEKRLDLATQPPAVHCLVLHVLFLFVPQSRRGTVLCGRLATTTVYRILLKEKYTT